MSDHRINPYASTATEPLAARPMPDSTGDELAGRFTRFVSALIDGVILMMILLPVQYATGFMARASAQVAGIGESFAMSLLGIGVMLALNGYLLFKRGQTIGKVLTKIQIVDFQSGLLLPFMKVYVYRYLWTLPIAIVVILIPGVMDDMLFNLLILIDALLIFGADRRCLHDLIAGSKVVLYMTNRPKVA